MRSVVMKVRVWYLLTMRNAVALGRAVLCRNMLSWPEGAGHESLQKAFNVPFYTEIDYHPKIDAVRLLLRGLRSVNCPFVGICA